MSTAAKREAFLTFIERHVAPHAAIKAVVVYGSVADGTAVASSDVDALVLMDPLDPWLVPAEAIWNPADDSFRSIFSDQPMGPGELQVDLTRVPWPEWSAPDFRCPPQLRAKLDVTWVAHQREGIDVEALMERVVAMSPRQQQRLLDAALLAGDGLTDDPEELWQRDELEALDALNAQWEALLRLLYAVNQTWFPYRARAVRNLARLAWRAGLEGETLRSCLAAPADRQGFLDRASALNLVRQRVVARLSDDPRYGQDPVFAAFLRQHDEPGRAWNMDEWLRRHAEAKANPPEPVSHIDLAGLLEVMPDFLGRAPETGIIAVLGLDERDHFVACVDLNLWHLLDPGTDLADRVIQPLRNLRAASALVVGYDDHHARGSGAEGLRRLTRLLREHGLPVVTTLQVGLETDQWRQVRVPTTGAGGAGEQQS